MPQNKFKVTHRLKKKILSKLHIDEEFVDRVNYSQNRTLTIKENILMFLNGPKVHQISSKHLTDVHNYSLEKRAPQLQ